jgi:hypothetical protein
MICFYFITTGPKLLFSIEHGLAVYYESESKEDKDRYHYREAYKYYLQYAETPWAVGLVMSS